MPRTFWFSLVSSLIFHRSRPRCGKDRFYVDEAAYAARLSKFVQTSDLSVMKPFDDEVFILLARLAVAGHTTCNVPMNDLL